MGQATRVTHDLLRFWEFALHGRGCRGYPACSLNRRAGILSLFPRPSFIALNIYPAPLHLVLTSMLHEIVRGPAPPDRTGAMQDPGYGLPRTHLLGTSVNTRKKEGGGYKGPPPTAKIGSAGCGALPVSLTIDQLQLGLISFSLG